MAMNTIFKQYEDPNKSIRIAIPANIRFKFYPKVEEVKLENIFAAIPLEIPLCDSMETAYPKIQKVTNLIKGNMSLVYGIYAISYLSNMILPRIIPKLTLNSIS